MNTEVAPPGPDAASAPRPVQEYLAARRGLGKGNIRVVGLSGDASTRRYFRASGGGRSVVLALYSEPFLAEELPFLAVRRLLDGYGLRVPAVLDVDGPRGIVMLEDLGDRTLQRALEAGDLSRRERLYVEAVDGIATLQRKAARPPRTASCFEVAFDVEKLSWELRYFLEHFVEGFRRRVLTGEERAGLSEAIDGLCREIASWPQTLCHRDFHSRNLMVHRESLFWIDFQDARMGPTTYDLASFLHDAYADVPQGLREQLMERFRERALPMEPREVFQRRFELMSVQRTLKALGTFGFMSTVRKRLIYDRYMPRALAHARRLLARYPELERLRGILARHVEELA